MKNLLTALLVTVVFFSCKKKEEEPELIVDPPPPVESKQVSVKINGVEKKCNACYSGYKSGGGTRGSNFYLAGFDEQISLTCFVLPKPGTYKLTKNFDPLLIYTKNNVYYKAVDGSLTITAIDTSGNGAINRLIGTFNFATDSSAGVGYTITEGVFNLK